MNLSQSQDTPYLSDVAGCARCSLRQSRSHVGIFGNAVPGRLGSERWFCSVSMAVQEALLVDCDIEVKVSRLDSKGTVDIFIRLAILCLE